MKLMFSLSFSLALASLICANSAFAQREVGNLVYDQVPEAPQAVKDRLEQYENVRSAGLQDWLPEGMLITTRFAESNQLHLVGSPLGYRQQLTFASKPVTGASGRPKRDGQIVYLRDIGGNEFTQIYRYNLASGRTELLSDGKSKNGSIRWQKNGEGFAFSSTRRNGKDTDIYFMRPEQSASQAVRLVEEGGSWTPIDWDQKGERLLVMKNISATENLLSILDIKSKVLKPVLAGGVFAFGDARFSQDGRSLFLVMDRDGEFQSLYRYTLEGGKLEPLSAKIPWDVEGIELSPDGSRLAFVANEDGMDTLRVLDTKTLKVQELKGLPAGTIGGLAFHPREAHRLGFSLSHAQSPSDVYSYDLKSNKLEAWTKSEVGGLNRENFVNPSLIHFPTFDQVDGKAREIPAFYYTRKDDTGKKPLLILIHGGPEAQFQPGFQATIQYMVNELGIAVIAPNVRGSSGYGKTYLGLDNGMKREDSVKDIGALLDWVAKQNDLDASKVVVMGGSYGGYMVLASLVHYSDRLAGGINSVGISHFVTFLTNTQDYRRDLRRVEYGDERDPAMRAHLEAISPLTNVQKIKKPLLVVQGLNDPRVPASEAEQIVKAVRAQGLESWYLLAKDEGHGFRKKSNQAAYLQTVSLFLEKILLGKNPS